MYADDLVLLSETANGMKEALSKLQSYCNQWGLTVNPKKTKVMVVNSSNQPTFCIDGQLIEIVEEVTYLGIVIDRRGHFKRCIDSLYKKGIKALFKLRKTITPYPKIWTCLHLFNHTIKPILLYGSEIWAHSLFGIRKSKNITATNIETAYTSQRNKIETVQLNFAKTILGVSRHTDNLGVYGELGLFPLYIDAIERMLKYWMFIDNHSENNLLKEAYRFSESLDEKSSWMQFARNIYHLTGHTSNSSHISLTYRTISSITKYLRRSYKLWWHDNIFSDSQNKSKHGRKLRTYRTFKPHHGMASYLSTICNPKMRISMSKFRLSDHRLQIELGRRHNVPLEERTCKKCCLNVVENECHALLECTCYKDDREHYLSQVKQNIAY